MMRKIHDTHIEFGLALRLEDLESLMPANEVSRPTIPDEGLDKPERLDAPFERQELRVARLQVTTGVVRSWVDSADSNALDEHERPPIEPRRGSGGIICDGVPMSVPSNGRHPDASSEGWRVRSPIAKASLLPNVPSCTLHP